MMASTFKRLLPIDQYHPINWPVPQVKTRKGRSGYVVHKFLGEQWWTNWEILMKGDPPEGVPPASRLYTDIVRFDQGWKQLEGLKFTQADPSLVYFPDRDSHEDRPELVLFDRGYFGLDARYFAFIESRMPKPYTWRLAEVEVMTPTNMGNMMPAPGCIFQVSHPLQGAVAFIGHYFCTRLKDPSVQAAIRRRRMVKELWR